MKQHSIIRDSRKLDFKIIGEGVPVFIVGFADYTYNLLPKEIKSKFKFILHNYFGLINQSSIEGINLSLQNLLLDIEAIQNYLKFPTMHILGHSSAGTVALDYILTHRKRIILGILICSPPIYNEEFVAFQSIYMENHIDTARKLYLDQLIEEAKKNLAENPQQSWFVEFHNAQRPIYFQNYINPTDTGLGEYQFNQQFINKFMEKTYKNYKRTDSIESINSILVNILGKYDLSVPVTSWDNYNTKKLIFENSAHYPMIEESNRFGDELLKLMMAT